MNIIFYATSYVIAFLEKAMSDQLLFADIEQALNSSILKEVEEDIIFNLDSPLIDKFTKTLEELFIQPKTLEEFYKHPLYKYSLENGTYLYNKLNVSFDFNSLIRLLEEKQIEYLEKRKKELFKNNWFIPNDKEVILPELAKLLADATPFETDLKVPYRTRLKLYKKDITPKKEIEVIPYKGRLGISCSSRTIEEDYKWSIKGSKVWSSLRGCLPEYGDKAVLTFVKTDPKKEIPYTYGKYNDTWFKDVAYGISEKYTEGAICFNNKLCERVIDLGDSYALQELSLKEGRVSIGGEQGWVTIKNGTWEVLYNNGTLVKGYNGLAELAAYAKGFISTKELPLGKLFSSISSFIKRFK